MIEYEKIFWWMVSLNSKVLVIIIVKIKFYGIKEFRYWLFLIFSGSILISCKLIKRLEEVISISTRILIIHWKDKVIIRRTKHEENNRGQTIFRKLK